MTIIFLGAGASKADGAPLQSDLFNSYFKISNANGSSYLKDFFRIFFGLQLDSIHTPIIFPTFEECLGVLDLAISKKETYKDLACKLEDFKSSLIQSMALSIKHELDEKGSVRKHHNNLVSMLWDTTNITFITTNYDLLLDNALTDQQYKPFYGLKDQKTEDCSVNLFKIHGSLNWLYCPTCKKIIYEPYQKTAIDATQNPSKYKCKICRTNQKYIIVPPTYFKDLSNLDLALVWYQAEKALTEADHIIFCGYSFPDADIHVKYMLKRAEINRKNRSKLKVSVFNHHKDKLDIEITAEENRFTRFFSKSTELKIHEKSFEDFAKNPTFYIDDLPF